MAVSFTNNFKNILDKLESIVKTEFKGALPTCVGYEKMHGTQYLRIIPLSSELVVKLIKLEDSGTILKY